MATELHVAGANTGIIQNGGGWKSPSTLSKYIIESSHEKRKVAQYLYDGKKKEKKKAKQDIIVLEPEPKSASSITVVDHTDRSKPPVPRLTPESNGTVVQADRVGPMGAWNLQSCTVTIYIHHYSEKAQKWAYFLNIQKLQCSLCLKVYSESWQ